MKREVQFREGAWATIYCIHLMICNQEGYRSHRPDVVLGEVGCLGRAVRNKPNQVLKSRALGREEQPIWFIACQNQQTSDVRLFSIPFLLH